MNPDFLRQAIRLSIDNIQKPGGGPFGAVVVRDGVVVGLGQNRVVETNDPTAHAEVVAMRDACTQLGVYRLDGCEMYTSCEPCPMCLAAIYWAHMDRIYYAATQEDAEEAGFDDAQLYRQIALPKEARLIPMVHGLRDEACAAFKTWGMKQDRVKY